MPWTPPKHAPNKNIKVAVVGAGPCGLTAALRLAQNGYQATVFERMPEPGGMMTYGIPAYRLPREGAVCGNRSYPQGRRRYSLRAGTGTLTLPSRACRTTATKQSFWPWALIGAVPWAFREKTKLGVYHGVQMLRDIALGKIPNLKGKSVVVVGAGDTAMDAARSALRLGAKEVNIVYRRDREQVPAQDAEFRATEEEGVKINLLVNPVLILGDQRRDGGAAAASDARRF